MLDGVRLAKVLGGATAQLVCRGGSWGGGCREGARRGPDRQSVDLQGPCFRLVACADPKQLYLGQLL
jgi:hypothetical protein